MTTNADERQPEMTLTPLAAAVDQAADPLGRLDALRTLTDATLAAARTAVQAARASGASWGDVGQRLGVSKQAVAKRYGDHPARPTNPAPGTAPLRPGRPRGWDVTTPRGRVVLRLRRR
jgi:hypothetical protein